MATSECLSCEAIQERICVLLDEISYLEGCQGVVVDSGDTEFDYREQIKAKYKALDILEKLEARKCSQGGGALYEFIQPVCTYPVDCGGGCSSARSQYRNRRRYK